MERADLSHLYAVSSCITVGSFQENIWTQECDADGDGCMSSKHVVREKTIGKSVCVQSEKSEQT
jgi:hypothetical protein